MSESLIKDLRNISKEDAIHDYQRLSSIFLEGFNPRTQIGNKVIDYFFFPWMINTPCSKGISFIDYIHKEDKWIGKPSHKRLYDFKIKKGINHFRALYDVYSLYWGNIRSFRASFSRYVYLRYVATRVLDPCAGWGGRCIGALSLGIGYTGFDTNTDLITPYEKLFHDLSATPCIIYQDSASVDYSAYSYDFVFTSPPYWSKKGLTERYANMPMYNNKNDFYNKFLFPMIRNSYKHLTIGKYYCLNINIGMYDDIIAAGVLPPCLEHIPMSLPGGTANSQKKNYK